MASDPDRLPPRGDTGPGGNDLPPSGEEARAQRRATSLPLVWLILGLVVAGLFTAWIAAGPPFHRPTSQPSAANAARLTPAGSAPKKTAPEQSTPRRRR
jgi:uncharacterized RDD family membrane protein YckC